MCGCDRDHAACRAALPRSHRSVEPWLARALPQAPGKIAHVLCVGNASREQLQMLRGIAPKVHAVRGDCDGDGALRLLLRWRRTRIALSGTARPPIHARHRPRSSAPRADAAALPEFRVTEIGGFRFGAVHGHQVRMSVCVYLGRACSHSVM